MSDADAQQADAQQHVRWRRLHPLSPLLRGGLALLVIAGIVFAGLRDRLVSLFFGDRYVGDFGPNEGDLIVFLIAEELVFIALLVVALIIGLVVFFSWLSWRFNTFRITDEAVEERSGIIFRQHRRAPLERIQSVNLQRPLLARIIGLTQVDVQTAGQGGRVGLKYLNHGQAQLVREQILRAAEGEQAPGDEQVITHDHVTAREQITGGAEIIGVAGVTGVAGGADQQRRRVREFIDADVDARALEAGSLVEVPASRLIASIPLSWGFCAPVALGAGSIVAGVLWQPFFLALIIPSALILIGTVFGMLNRGWAFTLSRSSDGIRVGAGLTATHTETIPLGRVHAIEARQPLLWRPFGWWRVRITTAGHSLSQGGQNRLQNTVLPVGPVSDVRAVFRAILPDSTPEDDRALTEALLGRRPEGFVRPARRAGWVLWFGWWRAGLQLNVGTAPPSQAALDPDAVPPPQAALDPDTVPMPRAALTIRTGALTRSLKAMPVVRAQSLQLRRPAIHRVLGLASVQAHTVLGPVRLEMRGLELHTAQSVFDRLAHTLVSELHTEDHPEVRGAK